MSFSGSFSNKLYPVGPPSHPKRTEAWRFGLSCNCQFDGIMLRTELFEWLTNTPKSLQCILFDFWVQSWVFDGRMYTEIA